MEENMGTQISAEEAGTGTDVQERSGEEKAKEPKLFTQEEVNGFIQSRIPRLKSQITKEVQADYNQKLAELEAREMKLKVSEKLAEKGMPRELAEVITCADEAEIEKKLDILQRLYNAPKADTGDKAVGFTQIGAAHSAGQLPMDDPVRKAMGLD